MVLARRTVLIAIQIPRTLEGAKRMACARLAAALPCRLGKSIAYYLPVLLLLCSCTSINTVAKQVAERFVELHETGKLPSIAPSDSLEEVHIAPFPQNYRISYPATVSVYAIKAHDPTLYIYTFTKETDTSLWRLTSAARRIQDGGREDLKIDPGQGM
jgi:hypothetical protein